MFPRIHRSTAVAMATVLGIVTTACSTYRSMSVDERRAFVAELEETALTDLVKQHPEAQADLERSLGHAIFAKAVTKVPVFGAGDGLGVVIDRRTGQRTFLRVGRIDVGGGLGTRKYRVVMIFFEPGPLDKLLAGKLEIRAGAEASSGAGDAAAGGGESSRSRDNGYATYRLADEGLSATWTVSVTRYSVLDLED